jgi:hypothetical protein
MVLKSDATPSKGLFSYITASAVLVIGYEIILLDLKKERCNRELLFGAGGISKPL